MSTYDSPTKVVPKLNVNSNLLRLSFGEFVPGQVNPLDNHTFTADKLAAMRQYFVQVSHALEGVRFRP